MIISKTPFRVSLFGGSTDYSDFYEKYGSLIISFAIDKYNYISIRETPPIQPYKYLLQYSKVEKVQKREEIEHNAIRGVLEYLDIEYGIELNSVSDVTKMSGLGTSSSYIVGLLNALNTFAGIKSSSYSLACETNYIERELLKEPGGYQDPYPAAYGGFNSIEFSKNEIKVKPMPLSKEYIKDFLDWSLMLYVGGERQSFEIASSHNNDNSKLRIKELALEAYELFCDENTIAIGNLLNDSWQAKRSLSNIITNKKIDDLYTQAIDNGALGGKLLGAGGSGFLYLICPPGRQQKVLNTLKLYSMPFKIDWNGTQIINK